MAIFLLKAGITAFLQRIIITRYKHQQWQWRQQLSQLFSICINVKIEQLFSSSNPPLIFSCTGRSGWRGRLRTCWATLCFVRRSGGPPRPPAGREAVSYTSPPPSPRPHTIAEHQPWVNILTTIPASLSFIPISICVVSCHDPLLKSQFFGSKL